MNTWRNAIQKKLKQREGMTTIEVAISILIVLLALGGFVDMVTNSQKFDTASSVTGYVGRVVGNQGGVNTTAPEQFSGNYVTSPQLYREVTMILKNGGIPEEDFRLLVNGREITADTQMSPLTFGERMKVELRVAYQWNHISKVVPTELGGVQVSSREVVSSFKVRGEDIETEYGTETP